MEKTYEYGNLIRPKIANIFVNNNNNDGSAVNNLFANNNNKFEFDYSNKKLF